MLKKPFFVFENTSETGIIDVPLNSIIHIETDPTASFQLTSKVGILAGSTIANVLAGTVGDFKFTQVQTRLDTSDPANPVLYMTDDGTPA